ncbi:MAG TPA: hypothetical protein VFB72_13130 [Verrucomicrobiae bacterium]|nr:hypothetical protein [Verrucomicrobiae bacterium]
MPITPQQFQDMQARVNRNPLREPEVKSPPATERILHDRIMEFCDSQWPRWKFIHARMDMRSTIAVGAPDFTIFVPGGKVVCVECKRKGQKPTVQQSAWRMEMNKLGHDIKLITSMDEFMDVVKGMLP